MNLQNELSKKGLEAKKDFNTSSVSIYKIGTGEIVKVLSSDSLSEMMEVEKITPEERLKLILKGL
jgi:hypothetical protein